MRSVAVGDVGGNCFVLGVNGLKFAFDVFFRIVVLLEALLWITSFKSFRAVTFDKLKMVHSEDDLPNNFHIALHDRSILSVVKD